MSHHRIIAPPSLAPAKGFSHGIAARGEVLYVGGQIGWDAAMKLESGFVAQFERALANICAVLSEAGANPSDVVRMTMYVVDIEQYRASTKLLREPWKKYLGNHYPAMALVAVSSLVEPDALLEIEATAVIGESDD